MVRAVPARLHAVLIASGRRSLDGPGYRGWHDQALGVVGLFQRSRRAIVKATPTGPATLLYPQLSSRAQAAGFAICERGLLAEIRHAKKTAQEITGLGPVADRLVVSWIVLPTRATNEIAADTDGQGPHRGDMQVVVEWLVVAGALRPLSEPQRDELVRVEKANRTAQEPFSWQPMLEATPWPFREVFDRQVVRDAWEVVPAVMIEVYPHLAATEAAWSTFSRSGGLT